MCDCNIRNIKKNSYKVLPSACREAWMEDQEGRDEENIPYLCKKLCKK
jgi:hypothetical protein